MLAIEKASGEAIVADPLARATPWAGRTKVELQRRGPGMPTVRADLIAVALRKRCRRREAQARDGADLCHFGGRAAALVLASERAGRLDVILVRLHESPGRNGQAQDC